MASMMSNLYSSATFDWVINDFSKVKSEEGLGSDVFYVGGFDWKVWIFPKGYTEVFVDCISVYLMPMDIIKFQFVDFSVSILNDHYYESAKKGFKYKFNKGSIYGCGIPIMPPIELHAPGKEYIVQDTCVLRVEVSCGTIDDDVSEDMYESNLEKVFQLGEYPGAGQPFGQGQNNKKVGFGDEKQEFEDIGGFHVLKTQAPLYRKIWLTYGHIPSTRVFPISSYPILVTVVKDLMSTMIDMYNCHYVDVSSSEMTEIIESWEDMIKKAEKFEFNIGWLRERFEQWKKAMDGMQNVKTELLEHGSCVRATNVDFEMIAEKDVMGEKISGLFSESAMETYLEIGEDLQLDGLLDELSIS